MGLIWEADGGREKGGAGGAPPERSRKARHEVEPYEEVGLGAVGAFEDVGGGGLFDGAVGREVFEDLEGEFGVAGPVGGTIAHERPGAPSVKPAAQQNLRFGKRLGR